MPEGDLALQLRHNKSQTEALACDVDEDLFFGNVQKDELEVQFNEPSTEVKFLGYIDQLNFQVGQELHAPLILLLKNATEASATKMMDSVDREMKSEQQQNAAIIEQKLLKPMCGEPYPEFMHGATGEVLNDVLVGDIGNIVDKAISKKQGQDLLRKKGLPLIEDEEWLNQKPQDILLNQDQDGKPMLNQDKVRQMEPALKTIKDAYDNDKLLDE